ncbi:MAG: hypothetical protein EOM08_05340 [Clostridia bacterium]|nr:hypothetical protein [Clostridia bacterium]
MRQRYSFYVTYTLVLTGVWMVLHDKPSWPVFTAGVAVSVLSLVFTTRVLQPDPPLVVHSFNPAILMRYLAVLMVQIYHSGFLAIWKIVRREETVRIERYDSTLEDELPMVMLANAVTLTPGTVTLAIEGRTLLILCFGPADPALPSGIKPGIEKMEQILKGNLGRKGKA